MLVRRGDGVIVEVIDNNGGAIARELNVNLKEKRADGAGRGRLAGECEEDVAIFVQEFQDILWGQIGAETCDNQSIDTRKSPESHLDPTFGLGRKDKKVVVSSCAMLEEGQLVALG